MEKQDWGGGQIMVLSDILDRLEGVQGRGGQYKARCPAHSDKKPSLSVSVGNDGKILLNCFAGCSTENIVSAMGLEMKDLFTEDQKNFPSYEQPKQKPTRTVEAEYLHNGGQTKKIKYRYRCTVLFYQSRSFLYAVMG